MTSQQTGGLKPTRRTLVKGAAWSVPVVAVGSAAPARAASPCLDASFSGSSCKEPGAGNNWAYQLSVCFTNNCGTGDLTVQVLRYVSNSGAVLDPQIQETLVVPGGETRCTDLRRFTSTNSANFIDVYFSVDRGSEDFIRLASPPGCTESTDAGASEEGDDAQMEQSSGQAEDTTVVESTPESGVDESETQSPDQADTTAGPTG